MDLGINKYVIIGCPNKSELQPSPYILKPNIYSLCPEMIIRVFNFDEIKAR